MKKMLAAALLIVSLFVTASPALAMMDNISYSNTRLVDTDPFYAGIGICLFAVAWIAVSFINGRHSESAYRYELARGLANPATSVTPAAPAAATTPVTPAAATTPVTPAAATTPVTPVEEKK